ncbi:MAG TPA: prolyl oligopeptidase family serine peptidase, partial [Longimicrobium sp.]|nr:prolyl oligopeptidase family serine peptidase [Longimicrobium sp.]
MRRTFVCLAAAVLAAAPAAAQERRPLAPADFDQWRTVRGESLSDDGRWAVFSLVPQVGDGEVVVRSTDGRAEFRHTRGFIGRPQTRPGATGPDAGYSAPRAQLTDDGRFAVFTIDPPRAEYEAARRARKKPAEMPKASLGILGTADGRVTVVPRVKSFRLADENGRWLAYLLEPDTAAARRDSSSAKPDSAAAAPAQAPAAAATPGGPPRPVSTDTGAAGRAKKKEFGSVLVLRDLQTGAEARIDDVVAYSFDENGRWLGYTVSSRVRESDGAYVRALADGRTVALMRGEGNYRSLVFDEGGTQVAFLSDCDEYGREGARYALYHASLREREPRARALVGANQAGARRVVAEKGRVAFSEDGRALRFGVAAAALDSVPADSLEDKAVFDLWHWRDPRLQPQQRAEAREDRDRSLVAVYDLGAGRWTAVGSDTLREVDLSEDFRVAMAQDPSPYAVAAMWGEGGSDIYTVDTRTGRRRKVAERVPFDPRLSPGGRYVLWFGRDRAWHAHEVATGREVELTSKLGARFDQETWDTPSEPAPWGVGGWTAGDRSVLLYDRYDVWEVDPSGRRPARVVTDSVGRRSRVVFRVVDLDPEEASIDPAQPLLLRAMEDETKRTGYWRDRLDAAGAPVRLVMEDRLYGSPTKAEDAEVYVFTRQTVSEAPDLWASGASMTGGVRLSDANPQQARIRWPSVELVRWRSDDGVELKGLLYKPEGFDPARKYPMVVYFYEQLSDGLHQYRMDVPRNIIQPTLYASNGYLVFIPDIHYSEGYPGASALKSIVPGVQSLVNRGFVDANAVGIQGQSWGGYQVAYMITRTPMFRAAMAGAPVANMTSAYGGIRWQSGLARSFQYEKGQSRIGGSLWERPMHYIENSPLFSADRVSTPLMIMHNDNDGAVPWYQGIEMFVALRRLGKEVYLINYNGDEHNPTKRANQLDVAIRMMQFFDHHLRGRPAPEWMTRGVPFLQKGRDQVLPVAEVPMQPSVEPAATGAAGGSGTTGSGTTSQ